MSPDANTATPTVDTPTAQPVDRRQRLRRVLLLVVPTLAVIVGAAIYLKGGRYVETDNAYVKADKIPISVDVSGTVRQVLVRENDVVVEGQPLFVLDRDALTIAVARAEANLAQARTDLDALKASYREKEAEIALARTRLAFAEKDQARQADLVDRHFVSAINYDNAKQATELARQQIDALRQDLARIAQTLGGSVDTPVETHPTYLAAAAELERARLDLAHAEVRAPSAGIVSDPPKPGQYITTGGTAMALVASGDPWVEANFVETDLTYVHPGEEARVRIDTFPGKTWVGVVDSVSPATSAEFSVIPAQNATGNWVKVAQRVPVRVKLRASADLPPLRAGLSAVVEIDTGHRRRLLGMTL